MATTRSKTWLTAVGAAGVLTLIFALFALLLYERTEARGVARHSQQQKLLAQLAAVGLGQRAGNYLHSAATQAARLRDVPEERWAEALAGLIPLPSGSNVLLVRPDGTVHFQQTPADAAALEVAVLRWQGAREPVLTNPAPPAASERDVVLLVPLLSEGRLRAQVGFTLPFAVLVETLLPPAASSADIHFSLLDEQGTVLANTSHPEMVGRQIPQPEGNCLPCHTSFALEQRMLAGEAGVDRLQVGEEPASLVAFTAVKLLGRRWSLSLTEPYSAIIADTRQGFYAITLLLGFALLVGIVAISLTLQYRVQRRRAEERAALAERRAALERQMLHNQQLAAIGRMTSQIAHQINTPLAALGLNVSYLQSEVASRLGGTSPEIEEVSHSIATEIDRLKQVVNDYLRFSRVPQPVLAVGSWREAVEAFVDFLEPEARERGVRLETELGDDPAYVRLDADLFQQAFMNLVRNSFEAMPEGGRLRLTLRRAGEAWELRLADTGRGIAADVLPRIFDPFFTTKKDGTGLGLAHTRRVVEQHGGTLECESTPGQGTTFTLRLPAVPAPAESSAERSLAEKGR